MTRGESNFITINTLYGELKERDTIDFSRSVLYNLLAELGLKYKKNDNRRALCERSNVVKKRIAFLRKYRDMKNNSNFIYLDETWIFARGSQRKSWQGESTSSVKNKPAGEWKHYIKCWWQQWLCS